MDSRTTMATLGSVVILLGGAACSSGSDTIDSAGSQTSTTSTGSQPTVTSTAQNPSPSSSKGSTTTTTTTSSTSAPSSSTSTSSPAGEPATCSATETLALIQSPEKLPKPVRTAAQTIKENLQDCKTDALVKRSTADKTHLSFGVLTPAQAWSLKRDREEKIYGQGVAALGLPWAESSTDEGTFYVWPRVVTEEFMDDDAAWQEAIDGGLITDAEAEQMRSGGSGYMGYRIGIAEDGTWMFAVAGD